MAHEPITKMYGYGLDLHTDYSFTNSDAGSNLIVEFLLGNSLKGYL
jgi:hypothetical protein